MHQLTAHARAAIRSPSKSVGPVHYRLHGSLGAFIQSSWARWYGHDRESRAHAAIDGSYAGTAFGLLAYFVVNAFAILSR